MRISGTGRGTKRVPPHIVLGGKKERAAAQATSGNSQLLEALRVLEQNISSAVQGQGNDLEGLLQQVEESARTAGAEAQGAAQESLQEAGRCIEALREELAHCRSGDEQACEANVLESLRSLHRKIGSMDSRMEHFANQLGVAIRESRGQTRLLRTLLSVTVGGHGRLPPRIVWVYPKPKQEQAAGVGPKKRGILSRLSSSVKRVSPSTWLFDTVLVTFICPVTLKVIVCGPDGAGFELKQPKSAVLEVLPYIQAGLFVLQVAVAGGRCIGLPLPSLVGVGDAVSSAAREAGAIDNLLDACTDLALESPLATVQDLGSMQRATEPGRLLASREVLDKSARSTLALLDKAVGQDWPEKCGLELVAADDGTVEWVHPGIKTEFQRRGSTMLGGQVEEPGFAGAGQSSQTRSMAASPIYSERPPSEVENWLEEIESGFSALYSTALGKFGLTSLGRVKELDEEDIQAFFEDKKVLGTLQDAEFPRMHKKALGRAMRTLAASASN